MNEAHLEFCASPQWRQAIEETILPEALHGVALGDDVIEIGPGPGLTTDVLRTLTARLTALEFDPDLADALAERMAGTNVEVICGDATGMDFPDGRFTGAASFHMLHHIPTDEAQDLVFAELGRVLRSGGTLVAADGVENESVRLFHTDDIYNPIDPATLDRRLTGAGFTSVGVRVYDLGWICTATAAQRATT
ncbi:MAG TPA: class I SAM-dependent methyltransferase [Acidimicrobiales bacterium]|nr:class I SAM-dependent methyltransferase [Acidimicrobiales bacterium]HLN41065.1 class I SAM-dependent methyltransferase [Acidimicrobiales bacterium]